MTRTKNRLFKTLVTVMLLIIIAFTVTGNAFAESAEVPTLKATYTPKAVTLSANFNCTVEVKFNVQECQNYFIFTAKRHLTANEPVEIKIEEFFSDEAIVTGIISSDVVEPTASESSEKPANNDFYIITIIMLLGIIIILTFALVIAISNAKSNFKKE